MDELVEDLIRSDFICDVTLPYLAKRSNLESSGALKIRRSALEDDAEDLEEMMKEAEIVAEKEMKKEKERKRAEVKRN